MNLEEAIINYRKEVKKMNTSQEELKKDLDLFSNKLIKLFKNMGIDYLCLKEARKRKNARWMFPECKTKELFELFEQLSVKESAASMVIVGKAKDVNYNNLLELVELCMTLLDGEEENKCNIDEEREKAFKMLNIPLLEIKQELYHFENVMDKSYKNDDSLPLEIHMKYQHYYAEQIRKLKIEAALVYMGMYQEYELKMLQEEAIRLKLLDGADLYKEKSREVGEILKREFPNLNITDKKQMDLYRDRRKELMQMSGNSFLDYIKYVEQQTEIDRLCGENQDYCELVELINKNIAKSVNFETKVHNYIKYKKKLDDLRMMIVEDNFKEGELQCPQVVVDDLGENNVVDIEELFEKNLELMRSIVKYKKNLDDTMLFQMAEQLFGRLI